MSQPLRAAGRRFEIQEFAKLAGVTVRALQHYDRLGLLKPARSRTGSRVYSEADLQVLVQIVALKSVGVPLKRIGALRADGPAALLEALGHQRRALERRQPLLDRMIFAVRNVEAALGRGEEADPAMLRPLMDALRPDAEEAQAPVSMPAADPGSQWETLREEWRGLLDDTEAAAGVEPDSETGQALAARWERLMGLSTGGGAFRRDLKPYGESLMIPAGRPVPGGRAFDVIGPALGCRASARR